MSYGSKRQKDLVEHAKRHGFVEVRMAKSGHVIMRHPQGGDQIVVGGSPGDKNAEKLLMSQIRRILRRS